MIASLGPAPEFEMLHRISQGSFVFIVPACLLPPPVCPVPPILYFPQNFWEFIPTHHPGPKQRKGPSISSWGKPLLNCYKLDAVLMITIFWALRSNELANEMIRSNKSPMLLPTYSVQCGYKSIVGKNVKGLAKAKIHTILYFPSSSQTKFHCRRQSRQLCEIRSW